MASPFRASTLLERTASRLFQRSFVCRQCQKKSLTPVQPVQQSHFLRAFHSSAFRRLPPRALPNISRPTQTHIDQIRQKLAETHEEAEEEADEHSWPLNSPAVGYWFLGCAASVFSLVAFGGLTRLTESGLSITEWRPVTGSLPPLNIEAWTSEFTKYQASPEFKLLNPHMNLDEFKSIYYMEWIHRQGGRLVGLAFVLPGAYLIARRVVTRRVGFSIVGIAGLIGFQGFLGWWMVKSGLKDDLFAPGSHPRVSQYRLTAHLGTALVCYTAMLWTGLSILKENKIFYDADYFEKVLAHCRKPELKLFRRSVAGLAALVFLTVMSGGFVAGLDAGLIYNEFPYMGEGLTPPKSELFSAFYSHREDGRDLWWRNMLENPSLVQLDHRILATTTFTSIIALWGYSRFSPTVKRLLPRITHRGMHGVVGFAFLQVTLGISTLIYLVPTSLASLHQIGAMALFTSVMVLGHRVWLPSRALMKFIERMMAQVKAAEKPAYRAFLSAGAER